MTIAEAEAYIADTYGADLARIVQRQDGGFNVSITGMLDGTPVGGGICANPGTSLAVAVRRAEDAFFGSIQVIGRSPV